MTWNCGASTMRNCLRATLFLQVGKNALKRSATRQIGLSVLGMRSRDELFGVSLSVRFWDQSVTARLWPISAAGKSNDWTLCQDAGWLAHALARPA